MPLNSQILALLQKAGQSLYDADQALQASVRETADAVQSSMSKNPFDMDNDTRFEEWKTIARLSKAVAQIEDELKKVYGVANAWTSLDAPPLSNTTAIALPPFAAVADLEVLQPINATDVIDKRQPRHHEKTGRKAPKTPKKTISRVPALRGNTAKLLEALQLRLTGASYTKLNRSHLALEIGLPKGSIGASLVKLHTLGYLDEDDRGALRLTNMSKAPRKQLG